MLGCTLLTGPTRPLFLLFIFTAIIQGRSPFLCRLSPSQELWLWGRNSYLNGICQGNPEPQPRIHALAPPAVVSVVSGPWSTVGPPATVSVVPGQVRPPAVHVPCTLAGAPAPSSSQLLLPAGRAAVWGVRAASTRGPPHGLGGFSLSQALFPDSSIL